MPPRMRRGGHRNGRGHLHQPLSGPIAGRDSKRTRARLVGTPLRHEHATHGDTLSHADLTNIKMLHSQIKFVF